MCRADSESPVTNAIRVGDGDEYEFAVELEVPQHLAGDHQIRVTAHARGGAVKSPVGEKPVKIERAPPSG